MSDQVSRRRDFIINIVYAAIVVGIVYLAVKYVIGWVLPFLIAFCIVSLVHPLINVIKKNLKIKQEIVSIIVMILIYALVALLLFLIVMQLAIAVRDGLTALPAYYEQTIQPALLRVGENINAFLHRMPEDWQTQLAGIQDETMRALQSFLLNLSQRGVSALSGMTARVPSFMIAFLFTIMLSFFISTQYEKVVGFIRNQLPPRARAIVRELKHIIIDTIFKYFKAALTLMVITFVELSIGLLLLMHSSTALAIAAGIAVFDALPFFGTGAIMIPWVIIELLQGNFTFALGIAVLYAVVTLIRNIIEPKVVGDKLGLNPIVSLSAIYLGFKLFGVLGMIVMPIITQIVMELHKKGTIRIFHETTASKPPPKESEA